MRIEEQSLNDLEKIGVYKITNLVNSKVYIGHTKAGFIKRFESHYYKLKTGKHLGYRHLQDAVNKYGIKNFQFSIIEICKEEDCLKREEYWIEQYDATNREKGYNIRKNPELPPMNNPEIREMVGKIIKRKYENGEMKPNHTVFKKGLIPWNKGKKYDSTNHLKVSKKSRGSREKFKETLREREIPINVYNLQKELILQYRYIEQIVKDSLNPDSLLSKSMTLHNPKGRNKYLPTQAFRVNIRKSCNYGITYKGLYFKYNTTANFKQGELLENPEMDNQQPSLSSNTFEGSTTNSRVLNEDSNADTSALPITNSEKIVIERDKDGNPLISAYWTIIDFSNSDDIV